VRITPDVADGQALGRQLALEQEGEAGLVDAQGGGVARALLRQDDPALAIDGGGVEQEFASQFAHQEQAGVDGLVVHLGEVELVNRLGEAGVGVGVGSESQAGALQHLDHLAFLHGLGAVEGHVLQEVGDAALGLGLAERAGVDAEADGASPFGVALRATAYFMPLGSVPKRTAGSAGRSEAPGARARARPSAGPRGAVAKASAPRAARKTRRAGMAGNVAEDGSAATWLTRT
jgi:hypothetical protein